MDENEKRAYAEGFTAGSQKATDVLHGLKDLLTAKPIVLPNRMMVEWIQKTLESMKVKE